MKYHHISEAGVSFEIQFGLWIKIWAGEHILLHMAANYRLYQMMFVYRGEGSLFFTVYIISFSLNR